MLRFSSYRLNLLHSTVGLKYCCHPVVQRVISCERKFKGHLKYKKKHGKESLPITKMRDLVQLLNFYSTNNNASTYFYCHICYIDQNTFVYLVLALKSCLRVQWPESGLVTVVWKNHLLCNSWFNLKDYIVV